MSHGPAMDRHLFACSASPKPTRRATAAASCWKTRRPSSAAGEFIALLGRSGSGKSTLLNLVSGIDRADAGQIWVGGQELTALGERERTLFRRQQIGFIFQFFNLIPTLTVLENVTLPLELGGHPRRPRARPPSRCWTRWGCSTGPRPSPTSSPAASSSASPSPARWSTIRCWCWPMSRPATWTRAPARSVLALLDRLTRQAGKNLLMVTHSPESAAWADRVFHLRDGKLEYDPAVKPGCATIRGLLANQVSRRNLVCR